MSAHALSLNTSVRACLLAITLGASGCTVHTYSVQPQSPHNAFITSERVAYQPSYRPATRVTARSYQVDKPAARSTVSRTTSRHVTHAVAAGRADSAPAKRTTPHTTPEAVSKPQPRPSPAAAIQTPRKPESSAVADLARPSRQAGSVSLQQEPRNASAPASAKQPARQAEVVDLMPMRESAAGTRTPARAERESGPRSITERIAELAATEREKLEQKQRAQDERMKRAITAAAQQR